MGLLFNNSISELNSSLFATVSQAASNRTVQIALAGRNGGPSGPEEIRGPVPA